VLERRDGRLFWLFPTPSYPQADGTVERQARERIRPAVLDEETPDERTAALIALVQAANLLDEIFAPDEREEARRRIVDLVTGRRPILGEAAVGHTLARSLFTGALFGLVGATLHDAFQRHHRPFSGHRYQHVEILEPWADLIEDGVSLIDERVSEDSWPSSTWDDRATVAAASSDPSEGGWFSALWSADNSSASDGASGQSDGSGGWSWWSSDSSDSGSSWDSSSGSGC
jgi:hypothetical protein